MDLIISFNSIGFIEGQTLMVEHLHLENGKGMFFFLKNAEIVWLNCYEMFSYIGMLFFLKNAEIV